MNFLHVRQLLQVYIHSYWRINIESYREKVITSNEDIFFHSGLKIRMMQSYKFNWDWHRQGHFCPGWGSNLTCSIMNGHLRVLFTHGSRKMPSLPSITFFLLRTVQGGKKICCRYMFWMFFYWLYKFIFKNYKKNLKINYSNRIWANPILGLKLFSGNSFRETALPNGVWITYCTLKYSLEI